MSNARCGLHLALGLMGFSAFRLDPVGPCSFHGSSRLASGKSTIDPRNQPVLINAGIVFHIPTVT
ncbi:MAG: hypothetical protein M1511_09860 [Deltaproteobacteria bacterium]|nr:hypothetical protein [Deltaproteobacteria bacterium]